MNIIIVHNAYQHSGGEDAVVDAEIALLRNRNHEVHVYRRHNDELKTASKAKAAISAIWSHQSEHEIEKLCASVGAELIHVHNTFPLVSPAVFWVAARKRIPVIQTLHNFRLLCPQAIFLRNGKVCEDCIEKVPWRAVTRRCYRGSAIQSAVAASTLTAHRLIGTYKEKVTRYIALNAFCRDKFIASGLPAERFRIKPNFVAASPAPGWNKRNGGLFVGRLSSEKGLEVLVDAVKLSGKADVSVIGSGPLTAMAEECFGEGYLGFRSIDDIMARMREASFLVVPSICYETFPRTIVEAYACGLPVIASRLGALVDIVKDGITGLLFNPGDANDLAIKIAWAESHPDDMMRMGKSARLEYDAKYTAERNYQILAEIYEDAWLAVQGEKYVA